MVVSSAMPSSLLWLDVVSRGGAGVGSRLESEPGTDFVSVSIVAAVEVVTEGEGGREGVFSSLNFKTV